LGAFQIVDGSETRGVQPAQLGTGFTRILFRVFRRREQSVQGQSPERTVAFIGRQHVAEEKMQREFKNSFSPEPRFNPNSEIGIHDLTQSVGGKAICRNST
jgi:hypothetical protein